MEYIREYGNIDLTPLRSGAVAYIDIVQLTR